MRMAASSLLLLWSVALFADLTRPHRVALVIGNGGYPGRETPYPINDANAIRDKLVDLQFGDIVFRIDATRDQMIAAIDEFGKRLGDTDQALVYYAGHGAQIGLENYLMPVDSGVITPENIEKQAITASEIYARLREGKSKFNLVILDACRDNPLLAKRSEPLPCNGWNCGLAAPKVAPPGTIIAYPTNPGSI